LPPVGRASAYSQIFNNFNQIYFERQMSVCGLRSAQSR
jgi:hypothetical protein